MIILYPDGLNTAGKYIRPYPLITINTNSNLNNINSNLPPSFEITLNGTAIVDQSSSIQINDAQPVFNSVGPSGGVGRILSHITELTNAFHSNNLVIEVCDLLTGSPKFSFKARLSSFSAEEGQWINTCRYSASFQADYAVSGGNIIGVSGSLNPTAYVSAHGGLIKSFSETLSLEPEEGNGNIDETGVSILRIYKLNRSINIVGAHRHDLGPDDENSLPWKNAINYYKKYKDLNIWQSGLNTFSGGAVGISAQTHFAYNHLVTENIDKNEGSYSINESWIISSGAAYENYNINISKNINEIISTKVTVEGTVKGLSAASANSPIYQTGVNINGFEHFNNAKNQYNKVSESGKFGLNSWTFKRAQRSIYEPLNPTPVSVSIGANEINGEITYNVEYDSRPTNFISGALSETININDTYPGDVFSVIPVIGRKTGPVLQKIGGRTEYQRNITIEAVMSSGYGGGIKSQLLFSKPSLIQESRDCITNIINELSPSGEPGIRKYFLSPPQETWNPKERRYSISLSWTYELDK